MLMMEEKPENSEIDEPTEEVKEQPQPEPKDDYWSSYQEFLVNLA